MTELAKEISLKLYINIIAFVVGILIVAYGWKTSKIYGVVPNYVIQICDIVLMGKIRQRIPKNKRIFFFFRTFVLKRLIS